MSAPERGKIRVPAILPAQGSAPVAAAEAPSAELSDDELEAVVGGLSRVWTSETVPAAA